MPDKTNQKLIDAIGGQVLTILWAQGLDLTPEDITLSVTREGMGKEAYTKIWVKYRDSRFANRECEQDFVVIDDNFLLLYEEVFATTDQMRVIEEVLTEENADES